MPTVPTVNVKDKDGNVFLVNESDYDAKVYPDCKKVDDAPKAKVDDAPKDKGKGEGEGKGKGKGK